MPEQDTPMLRGPLRSIRDRIQSFDEWPAWFAVAVSWMRFFGFNLGEAMPDENTIRHFRNRMIETGTLKRVMKAFDWQLHKKGYIPMSGQIVDATLVPAPKQRNTEGEKAAIKDGKTAEEICAYSAGSISADLGSKQRPEPVPPVSYCLMTQIDTALVEQVFYIS
jgi:hypothetical protein